MLEHMISKNAAAMERDYPSDVPRPVKSVRQSLIEQIERNAEACRNQARQAYLDDENSLGDNLWARYKQLEKRADFMRKGWI